MQTGRGDLKVREVNDPVGMHEYTNQSEAEVSQSEASSANRGSCKRSVGRTGLEVERLSQIKAQCTDQVDIHMCVQSIRSALSQRSELMMSNGRELE